MKLRQGYARGGSSPAALQEAAVCGGSGEAEGLFAYAVP